MGYMGISFQNTQSHIPSTEGGRYTQDYGWVRVLVYEENDDA